MFVMDYENYYERLSAIHSKDFNTCFYCGCEASSTDFIPPILFIQDWKSASKNADFISVPSCFECHDLLKKHNSSTLDSRVNALKKLLAAKYEKAVTIYNLWQVNELQDMDASFQNSLDAGIKLGAETIERLRFHGFDYEISGSITRIDSEKTENITVFGEKFTDYKEALEYASKAYQISKGHLSELYFENGKSFDKAISAFHRLVEEQQLEEDLKKPCREFAKKYSQNSKFVVRAVKRYMDLDEELSIEEALDKLFEERINTGSE